MDGSTVWSSEARSVLTLGQSVVTDSCMNVRKYLELAAQVSRLKDDDRTYFLGAVGLRRDGVLVAACNGNPKEPEPEHHAEARLLRKLGKGEIVFVARTLADGTWANAMPCVHCRLKLYRRGIERICFTTGPDRWFSLFM